MPYITRERVRCVPVPCRHCSSPTLYHTHVVDIYPIYITHAAHLITIFICANNTNCDFSGTVSFGYLSLHLLWLQILSLSTCKFPHFMSFLLSQSPMLTATGSNVPKYLLIVVSMLPYLPCATCPSYCSDWPPLTVTSCWPRQLEACAADTLSLPYRTHRMTAVKVVP